MLVHFCAVLCKNNNVKWSKSTVCGVRQNMTINISFSLQTALTQFISVLFCPTVTYFTHWKSRNNREVIRVTRISRSYCCCRCLSSLIFGSRSKRTDRANKFCASWPRAKYIPVRPDLTQSIIILSYDHFCYIFIFWQQNYFALFFLGPCAFFRLYHLDAYCPHTGTFFLWFFKEIARGAVPVIW